MGDAEFDEPAFLERLRAGEEKAFGQVVSRYHGTLVGVAAAIIGSRAQAEEVVQDTWIAVLNGIARFEGRSSLGIWLFRIVLNRVRTRIAGEGRLVGLPAMLDGAQGEARAVPAAEFRADGHWASMPRLWDELDPERVVGGRQLVAHVLAALEHLPAGQRAVLVLRDLEGQSAEEACALLKISAENQRMLLHRARGRIRKLLDELTGTAAAVAGTPPARDSVPRRGAMPRLACRLAWVAHPVRRIWRGWYHASDFARMRSRTRVISAIASAR
jgi:RNA polymerase sigma-70 factor (ECF subfamily)